MRQPGFNLGNRLLGGVFGFIRGVIIIAALSILLRAVLPDDEEDLLEFGGANGSGELGR